MTTEVQKIAATIWTWEALVFGGKFDRITGEKIWELCTGYAVAASDCENVQEVLQARLTYLYANYEHKVTDMTKLEPCGVAELDAKTQKKADRLFARGGKMGNREVIVLR